MIPDDDLFATLDHILSGQDRAALYVQQIGDYTGGETPYSRNRTFELISFDANGDDLQTICSLSERHSSSDPFYNFYTEPEPHSVAKTPDLHGMTLDQNLRLTTLPIIKAGEIYADYLIVFETTDATSAETEFMWPMHLQEDGTLRTPPVPPRNSPHDRRVMWVLINKLKQQLEDGQDSAQFGGEEVGLSMGRSGPVASVRTLDDYANLYGSQFTIDQPFIGLNNGAPVYLPDLDYVEIRTRHPDPGLSSFLAAQQLARNRSVLAYDQFPVEEHGGELLEHCHPRPNRETLTVFEELTPIRTTEASCVIVRCTQLRLDARSILQHPVVIVITPGRDGCEALDGLSGLSLRQQLPGWYQVVSGFETIEDSLSDGDLVQSPRNDSQYPYLWNPYAPLASQTL